MITSPHNPRVKQAVKLRKRSTRDELGLLMVEGYRELLRGLDNGWAPQTLFTCPSLFLGANEDTLVHRAQSAGADVLECAEAVFKRMAYRDRPEGLLAVGPQVRAGLPDIVLSSCPLLVLAVAIEKPGNLGTMLRSADAVAADAVIVCDRCTDINNPNVVRASVGTLFTRPVVEAASEEVRYWLKEHGIQIVAATPHATLPYTAVDFSKPTAVVMGTEQYGLGREWLETATVSAHIPMRGQADSLNVAAATTILLYEALRQRAS